MKTLLILFSLAPTLLFPIFSSAQDDAPLPVVVVGSKADTEGRVVAEIFSQMIEAHTHAQVDRRFGLGGTTIVFSALNNADIDLYPEYTGTIWNAMLEMKDSPSSGLEAYSVASRELMKRHNIAMLAPLGFNTLSSIILALLVALPLGIYLTRSARAEKVFFWFANVVQTVPSLALLAFLIPLFGLGVVPAIIALFLYALLPLLRNISTGIQEVDPLLVETGHALGLTPFQVLYKIELPLALPTMMAGVRTAAVIGTGVATLAAFIGAGGLGEPILSGLQISNTQLILSGAVPAALIALLLDESFEILGKKITPQGLLMKR